MNDMKQGGEVRMFGDKTLKVIEAEFVFCYFLIFGKIND